jgi:hypothetical protein
MAWQKGPLPADTYGWGAVVPVGVSGGFFFADFCGDHVTCPDCKVIKPEEVAFFDNSLTLPPDQKSGNRLGA